MAVMHKEGYDVFMQILDPRSGVGQITTAPVCDFVQGVETLSFIDLHARVIQAHGGILLGWRRADDRYPDINPTPKDRTSVWISGTADELMIFRSDVSDASMEPRRIQMLHSEMLPLPGMMRS